MNIFERYLSLWVALCMAAGVILGNLFSGTVHALQRVEFGTGSHINVPIAISAKAAGARIHSGCSCAQSRQPMAIRGQGGRLPPRSRRAQAGDSSAMPRIDTVWGRS